MNIIQAQKLKEGDPIVVNNTLFTKVKEVTSDFDGIHIWFDNNDYAEPHEVEKVV